MADVTSLYLQAPALHAAGERIMSTDEMTGIQALERKHPTIPMGPGRVERREFEYIRHGTVTLIANFDVAQGHVVAPSLGPTRTEADTPKHASWMNQIEMWFSILVRKLLKRASCTSVAELQTQVLAFIAYFNATMAKPFTWTYGRQPLSV